ncbi:Zinc finger, SWIM-type [Sesbania bispinosa]|nr:Zinc finger, SWIM-type [Sesbania bispinosa]
MDPISEHSDAEDCGLDNENVHVEDEKCFESVLIEMGFDSDQDFVNIDHVYLTKDLVMTFHFSDLEIAYEFYNWYGRMKGFSARKSKLMVAMKGKTPLSVITDGGLAMRNAIKRVLPNALHRLWERIVIECGLQDNSWVREIYEKRRMWATCFIRGHFFAGVRTTSRLSKYGRPEEWQVSFLPKPLCIKCCCKRMESFGLPCDHIIVVLVHLNFDEIPTCLVLDRWTIGVKENLYSLCDERNSVWDFVFMAQCAALDALSRKVNRLVARSTMKFNAQRDLLTQQFEEMDAIDEENNQENEMCHDGHNAKIRDPIRVGTKGRGVQVGTQSKRRKTCGLCEGLGHNFKTCSRKRTYDNAMMSQVDSNIQYDDFDDSNNATNNNDGDSNVNE